MKSSDFALTVDDQQTLAAFVGAWADRDETRARGLSTVSAGTQERNRPVILLLGVSAEDESVIRGAAGENFQVECVAPMDFPSPLLRRIDPALVVFDVEAMPAVFWQGGICDALHRIMPGVQLLLLADDEGREVVCEALEAGSCDVVAKPIVPAVLRARLQIHISLAELRRKTGDAHGSAQRRIEGLLGEIDRVRSGFIHSIGLLAEVRDRDTGAHLQRTRAFMRVLVDGLRRLEIGSHLLSPQQGDLIVQAAPLHDIGKIAIPDSILQKPGKLSDDERLIVMTHAAIGGGAINAALVRLEHDAMAAPDAGFSAAADLLQVASQIARSHHERWDGQGYPDRLAGEAIPLAARLMAVADVYDALTSPRPYKRRWAEQDVAEYIGLGRGAQFDPILVDVFIAERATFAAIAERYQTSDGH